jgi:cytochrome P450
MEDTARLVVRGTTGVFLSDDFHEKERWSDLSVSYARDLYTALIILSAWPKILRPVVHWILPPTYRLRKEEREACRIMNSFLVRKRQDEQGGPKNGNSPGFLGWMEQIALEKGYPSINLAHGLLGIAVGSTIPIGALLTNILLDLTANPEHIAALREEIQSALEIGGWKKTTLNHMRLLDSLMKETLRLRLFQASKSNCSKLDRGQSL